MNIFVSDAIAVVCIFAALYHYVAYPAGLMILASLRPPAVKATVDLPSVTLVIAAFNEERVIRQKLLNSLALDYPKGKLEVIVVADGSSDSTPDIVSEFSDQGVVSLFQPERRGKSHALNRAAAAARGEVLVFSDANNDFSANALRLLAEALADPTVGGVSGAKKIVENRDRAASAGDSLYWRYEAKIKVAESLLGGTVSADGEIFALRRNLYRPIPSQVINDDAFLTLAVVLQGYAVGYEQRATATEEGSISILEDFRVKVRMIAGGYQFLQMYWRELLGTGWFAFKFASHKILRWLMPCFLLTLLIVSAFRSAEAIYALLFGAQVAFYGVAALGGLVPGARTASRLVYVPFYFTTMNLAAMMGLVRFIRGKQTVLWSKAER